MDNVEKSRQPRLTVKGVLRSLIKNTGNAAAVSRDFKKSRGCAWKFIQEHPELLAVWNDYRQAMVDKAESVVKKAIDSGDIETARWTLKYLGRSRGYIERAEVDHRGEIEVSVHVKKVLIEVPTKAIERNGVLTNGHAGN